MFSDRGGGDHAAAQDEGGVDRRRQRPYHGGDLAFGLHVAADRQIDHRRRSHKARSTGSRCGTWEWTARTNVTTCDRYTSMSPGIRCVTRLLLV